jgi:hypothetical protein
MGRPGAGLVPSTRRPYTVPNPTIKTTTSESSGSKIPVERLRFPSQQGHGQRPANKRESRHGRVSRRSRRDPIPGKPRTARLPDNRALSLQLEGVPCNVALASSEPPRSLQAHLSPGTGLSQFAHHRGGRPGGGPPSNGPAVFGEHRSWPFVAIDFGDSRSSIRSRRRPWPPSNADLGFPESLDQRRRDPGPIGRGAEYLTCPFAVHGLARFRDIRAGQGCRTSRPSGVVGVPPVVVPPVPPPVLFVGRLADGG